MITSFDLARPKPSEPSRRELMIGSAVVGGALLLGACSKADLLSVGASKPQIGAFGPFIRIAPDGAVTVVSKHIEFGQGSSTGQAAIVAEEMDADWDKVSVEPAPADAKLYTNTLLGVQGTGGSSAINESWDQLRQAGAAARALFVQAAADAWKVPAGEVSVKNGVVSHAGSGRSASFGELQAAAAQLKPPAKPKLKDPKDFTLIGTERATRRDSRAKATGQARYTQDVYEPGLLTAVVLHSPRFGGKLKSFDATEAKKVKGVVDVFAIPTGVAVVAEGVWPALQGRRALKAEWDDSRAEQRSCHEIAAAYRRLADFATPADPHDKTWQTFENRGPENGHATGKAFAGETLTATYDFPYLAHAPMEPLNCTARVQGGKVKLVFGSQIPTLDQVNTALVVGTLPGAVEIETLYAGGSFGRRAVPDSDYVVECVRIAKRIGGGRPVKLMWTREDDMSGGRYRPLAHHAIQVGIGRDGFPAAWRHRIVIQSFMKGTPMMKGDLDGSAVEGVMGSAYFDVIPVVHAELAQPVSPVTTLWWRSVGATHAAMAMEHTIDQLAHRAGRDPYAYRRALLAKSEADRHLAVLDLAAQKAGWGQPLEDGWTRGIAVHESFGSVVANVAEVKLVDGQPKVRRVVVAIDCGLAVAPDQVRAQMEGGVCYGLSSALRDQITLKDGLVQPTNFDAYRVLRMDEAPEVETHIVPSGAHPSGAGEPGTPVILPAVANALLAATGKPVTSLPLVTA
jgi:isoquinoline 1-oxidoreductase beta subunit